jgi:hypothetical protein
MAADSIQTRCPNSHDRWTCISSGKDEAGSFQPGSQKLPPGLLTHSWAWQFTQGTWVKYLEVKHEEWSSLKHQDLHGTLETKVSPVSLVAMEAHGLQVWGISAELSLLQAPCPTHPMTLTNTRACWGYSSVVECLPSMHKTLGSPTEKHKIRNDFWWVKYLN